VSAAVDISQAFHDYYGYAIGVAFSFVRDRDTAEDLAALAFERLLRIGGNLGDQPSIKPWIGKTTANLARDLLRHNRILRMEPWDTMAHDHIRPADQDDEPEWSIIRQEDRVSVQEALAGVTEKARRLLILREGQGLSCIEIGQELGMTRTGVKSALFRARQELRLCLRQRQMQQQMEVTSE
jgi:RNA polymerase sigma-70 factor (ECF subfamily)